MLYLILLALTGSLGANPIEKLIRITGTFTYHFIILTLAVTPVYDILKINHVQRYKKTFGLFSFFYASLHFMLYAGVDHFFNFMEIFEDMIKHKRIYAGVGAYLIMIPLAVTSTRWAKRTLGGRRWRGLHRLFYLSAIAAAAHYLLVVKRDLREPVIYFTVVLLLLLYRLRHIKA
ncbi:MAG: sulfoxide reductase heme-binding subunit YedZ [Nitrospirae bacterium]|nr:sulfoxide reductase heme-binding subunit YedZ [Nitrospirota bacterium]MBF0533501.1 sulfoxide reductase heme-binding subunit YedZ [Nitrospirota bacterium]MBF0615975.1 sulfoxide reductase heme-binding subunit YedZ [Nitrospirota bacterium]